MKACRIFAAVLLTSLLTLTVEAKTYYFPHYGDGGGISMLFSITNSDDSTITGTLKFYDPTGSPQTLPLNSGAASQISLNLPAFSTRVYETNGTSNPVKTGYAILEIDSDDFSAVAVFQFDSGLEASVLPAESGTRYSMFVERNAAMDTGVAFARSLSEPITLRLYDDDGQLVETEQYDPAGLQESKFLSELFDVPTTFRGSLTAESEEAFAAVGLRFGAGVLSTLAVTDLTQRLSDGPVLESLFSPNGGIRSQLVSMIDQADSTIDIAIYSFSADELREALIRARTRGVSIRVIADAGQAGGVGGEIPTLEGLGFNVRRTNGGNSSGEMHNKYMIVDGQELFTGSYDWSAGAEDDSYENALFIENAAVISDYISDFSRIWIAAGGAEDDGGSGGTGGNTGTDDGPGYGDY